MEKKIKSWALNGDGRKRKILCSLCAAESREKQLNSVSSYVLKQQLVECMGKRFLGVSQNPFELRQQVLNSFLFLAWDSACFYPATSLLIWIKITKIIVCLYKRLPFGVRAKSLCEFCVCRKFSLLISMMCSLLSKDREFKSLIFELSHQYELILKSSPRRKNAFRFESFHIKCR